MATTAHVGDTRALIFPVMCDGHLKIEYDDYNTNNSKDELWDYGGPFSIEAIVTPYDVNGVGHRISGKGRLDSTKTPPSPNLSLDDQADATSNYESVSYFGAGRDTHKMMIFCNDYLKFYLQNTTSSNFNQPAEYKIVVELTDSIGTPISHTVSSEPVFVSKKSLTGYYDPDGLYNGITTDKTKVSSSASTQLPTGSITVTGDLSGSANSTATLGTATITIANAPTTANGSLDTTTSSGTNATGTITFSSGWSFTPITASTTASDNNAIILRNRQTGSGTSANKTYRFFCYDNSSSNGFPSDMQGTGARTSDIDGIAGMTGGLSVVETLNIAGYLATDVFVPIVGRAVVSGSGQNGIDFRICLNNAINTFNGSGSNPSSGLDIDATTASTSGNTGFISLIQDAIGTAGNHSTTPNTGPVIGSSIANGGKLTATVFSGGTNATSASNINQYITVKVANTNGSVSGRTKKFKFYPTGTSGNTTTTANGTSVIRVNCSSTNTTTIALQLRNAINHNNAFGAGTATSAGNVVTITSPNTSAANQPPTGTVLAQTSGYSGDSIVSFGSNPYQNYVAAITTSSRIAITDSAGVTKNYKPAVNESQGSTGTDNGVAVVYFTNGGAGNSNQETSAQNLLSAITGGSGHGSSLTVSRTGKVVSVSTTSTSGSPAMSLVSISSGISLNNFSSGSGNGLTVASGETDDIGAGNQIYNNNGVLIGTVASASGTTITLADTPATPVTSTIYRDQQKEALYLEQVSKVGMSFDGNTITLYQNNQPVKRVKVNIGKFRLDTSPGDCFIGQDASLSATARKATQFMGELYEIAFHKSAIPCPTITTLTPNYSDTLFYYSFGD